MNLEEFSRNTAEKFISNVLVIDDKFNYESTEISKDIITPNEFDLTPEDIQSASPQESSLNAIKLIQAFANKNIHCTPFLFTTTIPYGLINKSDILILDWELPSVNCCDIIKEIIVKLIGKTQSLFIYTNKKKEEVIKSLSECNFDNISSVCNNDIFLLPSLWEGLPISLLEAMYMKKVCIVSDVIGNRDVIENGKNGYICRKKDEYINIIKNINVEEFQNIIIEGYGEITKEYNTNRMIQQYKEVYSQ